MIARGIEWPTILRTRFGEDEAACAVFIPAPLAQKLDEEAERTLRATFGKKSVNVLLARPRRDPTAWVFVYLDHSKSTEVDEGTRTLRQLCARLFGALLHVRLCTRAEIEEARDAALCGPYMPQVPRNAV